MAAAGRPLSEDQFLCSICLDVFNDPVTIPCGHNFCKSCITEHLSVNSPGQCPLCKEHFLRKPDLRINTFISELAANFRKSVSLESSSLEDQYTSAGEVFCDLCTETKEKAMKSCLDCLVSYCEIHLEPHQRLPSFQRHMLIPPVENLECRICKRHKRPLEYFCKMDQKCVCQFCTESAHKSHPVVSLREEYEGKKTELGKTEGDVQEMIEERRRKIEQIKQAVKLSKGDAERETVTSVQVFTALIRSVEEGLAQLIDQIQEKHRTTEKQAEGFIKELEEEIAELTKRSSKMEQLSSNKDHLLFLQSFPSLKPAPPTKDWTKVSVYTPYEGTVRRAVAQVEGTFGKESRLLCASAEIKKHKLYSVEVTLDPETANSKLVLSEDRKQVYHADVDQNVPDSPKRFLLYYCVLGKQSFSSGRFYYEVQVEGKTDWVIGVATESVGRKGTLTYSPKKGTWTIWLSDGKLYKAYTNPPQRLHLNSDPRKIGVFVNYEEGLVSFYDVDAPALIYSFTGCNFTNKLHPIFNPRSNDGGKNSNPLIICQVNHSD